MQMGRQFVDPRTLNAYFQQNVLFLSSVSSRLFLFVFLTTDAFAITVIPLEVPLSLRHKSECCDHGTVQCLEILGSSTKQSFFVINLENN